MVYTVNFGSGGTSTNGASNTTSSGVYMYVGGQTGNLNLAGSTVTIYNDIQVTGPYSNCTPSWDGSNVHLDKSGTGTMYFSRFTGDGGVVYDNGGGDFGNGGLHGYYTWSTVPTAPATIATSRSGRNVTVTNTASGSNGGQSITSYYVQYRSSATGTGGWSAWGNTADITSLSYTYTSLTPALYYQFRVYANNTNGASQATASGNVLVSSGGKIYNGSAWVSTSSAKIYNGSAWVDLSTAKIYNGSAWVDLA